MREHLYYLVRKSKKDEKLSKLYDYFIMVISFLSLVPLMFKQTNILFDIIDIVTVYIIFMDYVFRWICADKLYKHKNPIISFIVYPFTPFAILDFLSILPSLGLLHGSYRILRLLRLFKLVHYSKTFLYISNVFKNEKKTLLSVLLIALGYIVISALVMFTHEPDTFVDFFHALYWATTALTTVGYGDVYPVTQMGRLISMISSLFGIAVIALPAGIITAGFMEQINNDTKPKEDDNNEDE